MKRESCRHGWWVAVVATLLMLGSANAGPAQPPAAKKSTPAVKKSTPRKKPRGRLPAYYSRVVTAKQREQIYSIQAKFTTQIDKLQDQLKELLAQRDGEVEKVLTDEQRSEVEQMRKARKTRTTGTSAANPPTAKPATSQ